MADEGIAYGTSSDPAYPLVELPSFEPQPERPQITISKPSPPAPIRLVPVEHAPDFSVHLHPVEHVPDFATDPGSMMPELQGIDPFSEAGQKMQTFVRGAVEAPAHIVTNFIDSAHPHTMPQEGQWSDEQEALRQLEAGQQPGAATDVALSLLGGASAFAQPGSAGIFGGKLAHTADLGKLAEAQHLEAQGANPTIIWSRTGWFKGPDAKWRFGIADKNAIFHGPPEERSTLGRSMDHPDLYSAYPGAEDLHMDVRNDIGAKGAYLGPEEGIELDPEYVNKSVALHEIQHHIQRLEGFAPGGNFDVPEVQAAASTTTGMTSKRRVELIKRLGEVIAQRDQYVHNGLRAAARGGAPPGYAEALRSEFWEKNPQLKDEVDRIHVDNTKP